MNKRLCSILLILAMAVSLMACSHTAAGTNAGGTASDTKEEGQATQAASVEVRTDYASLEEIEKAIASDVEDTENIQTEAPDTDTDSDGLVDAVNPDLKEYLDSYEAFVDEYCEFMKKYYNASATDMLGMVSDYTDYVSKLSDMESKLNDYDSSTMTTVDALYYSEVLSRCTQKMLDVTQ